MSNNTDDTTEYGAHTAVSYLEIINHRESQLFRYLMDCHATSIRNICDMCEHTRAHRWTVQDMQVCSIEWNGRLCLWRWPHVVDMRNIVRLARFHGRLSIYRELMQRADFAFSRLSRCFQWVVDLNLTRPTSPSSGRASCTSTTPPGSR